VCQDARLSYSPLKNRSWILYAGLQSRLESLGNSCSRMRILSIVSLATRSTKVFAPFMIHETLPTPTETAFGSHPCCVVSVTYIQAHCFHGGNTGSNPVGDAKFQRSSRFGHDVVTIET